MNAIIAIIDKHAPMQKISKKQKRIELSKSMVNKRKIVMVNKSSIEPTF